MRNHIYDLKRVRSVKKFGQKAVNLARLRRFGFNVPETRVLSSAAFQHVLRFIRAIEQLNGHKKELKPVLNRIHDEILNFPLPKSLEHHIRQLIEEFEEYGIKRIAVRSSAISEDRGDYSFAGQYETILNVPLTLNDVWLAVKNVWASLFKPSLWEYCQKNGLPNPELQLAVILQEMVDARIAGVAFSLDPNKPENEKIIIEYVEGVAEKLVSGEITPQHIEITRHNFNLNPDNALDWLNNFVEELLRLEKLAGEPVDVEWAFRDGQLFFLQYRPITTLKNVVIWTRENVGEVIPDVVTPFTWSILEPITNGAYHYFLKKIGLKLKAGKLFTLFNGRVYFNHNAYQKMVNAFYVSTYIVPGRSKIVNLFSAFKLLFLLGRLWYLSFRFPVLLAKILKKQENKFKNIKSEKKTELNFKALKTSVKMIERLMKVHICSTILAEFYYQLLNKICHETLKNPEIDASRLLQGVGQIESIKPTLALWEIAHWIQQNNRYRSIFENESVENIITWWNRLPQNDILKKQVELFLENFGYAALHEFEISYPRWHEDTRYIFGTLKQYVQSAEGYSNINRQYKQTERDRQIIVEAVKKELRTNTSRGNVFVFNYLLKKAEYFSFQREFLKQKILKWLDLLKQNLVSMSMQLLGNENDIFFLEVKEIKYLINGSQSKDQIELRIKQRQAQKEKYMKEKYPKKIRQIGEQWMPVFDISSSDTDLRGLACSAGTIEGRACVILDAQQEGHRFMPGDILVTRATNPGWTPILALAGGIVTELGGALSHGAIIAREFSIPMVAAVEDATQKIKTGQWIRVNGQTGTIEILKEVVH